MLHMLCLWYSMFQPPQHLHSIIDCFILTQYKCPAHMDLQDTTALVEHLSAEHNFSHITLSKNFIILPGVYK